MGVWCNWEMVRELLAGGGYDPEVVTLWEALEDGDDHWIKALGKRVSGEAMQWAPVEGAHSIGYVLLHTVEWERWWCQSFVGGERLPILEVGGVETRKYANFGKCPKPPAEGLDWYLELMMETHRECLPYFKGRDAGERIQKSGWDVTVQWVAGHMVDHDSYHGGQAVLLHELWKSRNR